MNLKDLLGKMRDVAASDIFIVPGLPLSYTAGGRQRRLGDKIIPAQAESIVKNVYKLAGRDFEQFAGNHNHDDDFSFAIPGISRYRANVFRQRGSYGCVIRAIPFGLPDPEALGITEDVLSCADYQTGMVLVTGPSGMGKTTTLACMIDRLNKKRNGHIITMEDPIEYIHSHEGCIVTQREIPTDVATYGEALRSAMRESPNVLLLGEMRDAETIATAVSAAEMSQLLFSTLHTNGAAASIDRIVDAFPASQQRQIRIQLSLALRAVISQQLVSTVDGGLVPAFEIMRANTAIRNLIREGKTHQIDSVIASGGAEGMRTMDQSLLELFKQGAISMDTAMQYSIHTEALEKRIQQL